MPSKTQIISIEVRRNEHGWFVAESDDLLGLYVVGTNRDAVINDIAPAIAALFEAKGQSVELQPVEPSRSVDPGKFWGILRPTMLSAAMA
jgi:hypothetical protein